MSELGSPRRFYLMKRLFARQNGEDSEGIWRAKQEAEPGTSLPSDFPLLSKLAEVGYTTNEDLIGADVDELVERAGLSRLQAEAVIGAFQAL